MNPACLLIAVLALLQGTQKLPQQNHPAIERYFKNPSAANEREFFDLFVSLPAQDRVNLFIGDEKRNVLTHSRLRDVVLINQLDTIPFLAEIVRNDKTKGRIIAVQLLCDMDKFVALRNLPIKLRASYLFDFSRSNFEEQLQNGGQLNQFMSVDGRRIDSGARDCVYWAAEQRQDPELRFWAREGSGLLLTDLRSETRSELVSKWTDAVKKRGSFERLKMNAAYSRSIGRILMEDPPATVLLMTDILNQNSDKEVRSEAFIFLQNIDQSGIRLRSSELGRSAIKAMHGALLNKRLSSEFEMPNAAVTIWNQFTRQAFDDSYDLAVTGTILLVALAFDQFFGERVIVRSESRIDVVPQMHKFIAYLTYTDPTFPSWQFHTYGVDGRDSILHPRFRQKITQFYATASKVGWKA